jgi:uncharacterized protein YhaN
MMRIRRLDLDRFGHFTGQHLDFGPAAQGGCDFHLVHGPNEAGKTTLMEAFLRLLYGFAHRSEDYAFLHPQETLQVGGLLEIGGKETLLTRVKRRGSSLLDRDQQALPESVLESVLGGLGQEEYRKLLCLDDSTIEKGGDEILKSEGDIGALLFSAAAGVSGLSAVLAQTADAAEAFYKKGGSKSEQAKLKKQLEDIAARIRESDVSAPQYRKLLDEFERQKASEEELRSDRARLQGEQLRLAALVEAHGIAARWVQPRAALAALSHYPASVDVDPERLVGIVAEQAALVEKQHDAGMRIARLESQLSQIYVSPVIGFHDALEAMDGLKGRAQGAFEDLPKREEERARLLSDMAALVAELGVSGDPQGLALPQHRIDMLTQAREAMKDARLALAAARKEDQDAGERVRSLGAELEAAGSAVAGLPEIGAILSAHGAERLAADLARSAHAVMQAESAAREAMAEMQVEGASFSGLPAIALTPQEAAAHARLISEALIARRHAREEHDKALDNVRVVAARLAAIESSGDLVDSGKAAAGRAHRDALWQVHRGRLDGPSADAFEAAMRESDRLADLRQTQAAQLAQLFELRPALGEAEAKAENARRTLENIEANLAQLQGVHAGWLKEAGLPPGFPASALADWLEKRMRARKAAVALVEARSNAKPLEMQADALRQALAFLPGAAADADIAVVVRQASAIAREQDALKAKSEAADRERTAKARRETRLRECESEDARCTAQAQALAAEIFPGTAPSLDDAIGALQNLRELNEKVRTLEERSIGPMRRDLAEFEQRIGGLNVTLAGYRGLPALECWRLLRREVDDARNAAAEKARLERQLADARQEQQRADNRLAAIDREIAMLGRVFPPDIAVGNLTELRQAVTATRDANALRLEIAGLQEQVMARLGVGDIEAAHAMLAQMPAHEAAERLAVLNAAMEETQARLEAAISGRTSAGEALARVGGDADIAELGAERRAIEARLEEGVLRHLEDRFGVMLAERALRRYRDKHRSAMLQSAEAAFRMLTNGVYSRLVTQASGSGETLVAIRERDGQSKLAAQMSKGTRFQLYLALRAAAYEQMTANGVVLPFFCDDIFETFDEDRTTAACSLMQRIGHRGQAIYLTHHQHVVDIARKVCGDAVRVHTLPPAGLAAA